MERRKLTEQRVVGVLLGLAERLCEHLSLLDADCKAADARRKKRGKTKTMVSEGWRRSTRGGGEGESTTRTLGESADLGDALVDVLEVETEGFDALVFETHLLRLCRVASVAHLFHRELRGGRHLVVDVGGHLAQLLGEVGHLSLSLGAPTARRKKWMTETKEAENDHKISKESTKGKRMKGNERE